MMSLPVWLPGPMFFPEGVYDVTSGMVLPHPSTDIYWNAYLWDLVLPVDTNFTWHVKNMWVAPHSFFHWVNCTSNILLS